MDIFSDSIFEEHELKNNDVKDFAMNSPFVGDAIRTLYDKYSQMIPKVGKLVVGDEAPYQYLVDTIEKFPSQQEFRKIIENNGFIDVEYRNIFNGVVAIHSAWKK